MIGKTISHYRIISQLGLGGMGVVYAAEDPRLGRQVALKFVPEELAHDPHALDRLRGEARAASSLNHPNICTIHDIGEHEGRPFIVMELLTGHSLRDRITQRPLKVHEAVDVGIQVADALERAHSRGVIHRDIKPANLFLVDRGPVKVLDFGLAKMLPREFSEESAAETIEHRTAPGVALGTVAYMSPEQVRGDQLDGRTDLFSLGAVLYECVTGQQPFKGKTSAMIFAAILTEAPTAPVSLNHDVPLRLQDVINNCLEKDRELRYQDAAGLRAELKRVRRDLESGAARSSPTVAVPAGVPRGDSGSATRPEPIVDSTSAATTATITPTGGTAIPPPPRKSNIGRLVGGVAAVVVVILALFFGRTILRSPKPAPEITATQTAPDPAVAERTYQQALASFQSRDYRTALANVESVLAATPAHAGAIQLREQIRSTLARFDRAVGDAQRLLEAGDAEGAARALEQARAIEPGAPEVAQLAARLVDRFRAEAGRSAQQSARANQRPAPVPTPATAPREPASAPPPAAPRPVEPQRPIEPPPAPVTRPAEPPPAPSAAPAVEPPPPAAARPEPPPSRPTPPPAAAPAQDDEAAIRRVVATYARAIETKDLGLFRTVKPNLSQEEQRRLTEGFRAVTSQQVSATVTRIEHRGNDAIVHLTRRDTILASGRQQTTTMEQTLTLTQTNGAWVIREIGR